MIDAGETAALNALWAGTIVEELVRLGVTRFAIAPGSRSTPLTLAAARHPDARCTLHIDERGCGFFALGHARATGRPAAVICTSGTAVANLLPAAVEAAMDDVPLLLLTADRPPELRDTAANQTVHQPGLFGVHTRWAMDLPAPDRAMPAAALLTAVDQAVARTMADPAGPVHLNLPFREPLSGARADPADGWLKPVAPWHAGGAPFTAYRPAPLPAALDRDDPVIAALAAARRGLVVVGRLGSAADSAAAAAIAGRLGWPVIADVASGLRLGRPHPPRLVAHADLILRDRDRWPMLAPDTVLHLGGESVSKPLGQFLAGCRPARLLRIAADPRRRDPTHQTTLRLTLPLPAAAAALAQAQASPAEPGWAEGWQAAEAAVAAALAREIDGTDTLDEPAIARRLAQALPSDWGLFLGSSMPIRDMDIFAAAGDGPTRVAANRGASGIDGTIATACGFAAGLGRPVALLLGDLAALHDLNALMLLRAADPPVLAVVVNNDGGGIFSFLPVAGETDAFETWFGTPHGLSLAALARGFGLPVATPGTRAAFRAALAEAVAQPMPHLIELCTARTENRARHRDLEGAALDALRASDR